MRRISGSDGSDFQIYSKSTINIKLTLLLLVVELSGSLRIMAPSLMSKDKTRHFPLHPPNMPSQQGHIAKKNPPPTRHSHSFHGLTSHCRRQTSTKFAWSLSLSLGSPQITLSPSPLLVAFSLSCLTNFSISVPHGCIPMFYFLNIYTLLILPFFLIPIGLSHLISVYAFISSRLRYYIT